MELSTHKGYRQTVSYHCYPGRGRRGGERGEGEARGRERRGEERRGGGEGEGEARGRGRRGGERGEGKRESRGEGGEGEREARGKRLGHSRNMCSHCRKNDLFIANAYKWWQE